MLWWCCPVQAVTYLPPDHTKRAVHKSYSEQYDELRHQYVLAFKSNNDGTDPKGLSHKPLQYNSWCQVWDKHCSTVRVRTARSDICDLCKTLRERNTPEARQLLLVHLAQAKSARDTTTAFARMPATTVKRQKHST